MFTLIKNTAGLLLLIFSSQVFAQVPIYEAVPDKIPEYVLRQQQMRAVQNAAKASRAIMATAQELPLKGYPKFIVLGAAACAAWTLHKFPPQPAGVCPLSNATPAEQQQWFWAKQMARSTPLKRGFAGTNREYLERRQQEILDEYHEKFFRPSQDITAFQNSSGFESVPEMSFEDIERLSETEEERVFHRTWVMRRMKPGVSGKSIFTIDWIHPNAMLSMNLFPFQPVPGEPLKGLVKIKVRVTKSQNEVVLDDCFEPDKWKLMQQASVTENGKQRHYRVYWNVHFSRFERPFQKKLLELAQQLKKETSTETHLSRQQSLQAYDSKFKFFVQELNETERIIFINKIESIILGSPNLMNFFISESISIVARFIREAVKIEKDYFEQQNLPPEK